MIPRNHVRTMCNQRSHRGNSLLSAWPFGFCGFDRPSFCARDWRVSARTGSCVFNRLVHLCRANRLVKRLGYLLGRHGLVRCTRSVYLVALGVVGRGTCSGFTTNAVAMDLAGAVRLSSRYRRISLHSFNAAARHWVVVNQVTGSNAQHFFDSAAAYRRSPRFRSFRARMAGVA